jgi:HD-GYP domain-containing protein (c-di-GMP phosphodiesterase class II)
MFIYILYSFIGWWDNMDGFYLGDRNKPIEKVAMQTEELSLLAKCDGIEIMHLKILPDIVFYIDPSEEKDMMEFFYILDGSIEWEDENKKVLLNQGQFFYVHNLSESTYFKTLTEVHILYVASQPVFHFLSNEIENLSEMRKKVEEKDLYTHDHGVRSRDYAMRIGEKLNYSKKQLNVLFYSSVFHDIGKINVPDYVLNKPGRLTSEEFDYIKKHSGDGAEIIKNTFLSESAKAILQHHERLDGSGYPMGIKGNEICLDARIIRVVDSYDAMTSDRPYRKAMEPKEALDEIKSLVGKHYDGKVVACLEDILKEDEAI